MNTQETTFATESATSEKSNANPEIVLSQPSSGNGFSNGKKAMLYRHPTEKMLGGVCGGLAEYTGFDPILMRALWVIATLMTGGSGFLAYLALWLLLPVGSKATGQVRPAAIELNQRNLSWGANVLIIVGVLWLLSNIGVLGGLMGFFGGFMRVLFWPLILIGAGYLLLRSSGKEIKFNMNWNDVRERVQSEGSRISSDMNVKSSFANFRQNFPLRRSNRDKMLMGVCGGIAQKIGIDANLVRLMWVALTIGSIGTGVVIYVLVGLFLPADGELVSAPAAPVNTDPVDVQIIDGSATKVF